MKRVSPSYSLTVGSCRDQFHGLHPSPLTLLITWEPWSLPSPWKQFTYYKYTKFRTRFWFLILNRICDTVIPFPYLLTWAFCEVSSSYKARCILFFTGFSSTKCLNFTWPYHLTDGETGVQGTEAICSVNTGIQPWFKHLTCKARSSFCGNYRLKDIMIEQNT